MIKSAMPSPSGLAENMACASLSGLIDAAGIADLTLAKAARQLRLSNALLLRPIHNTVADRHSRRSAR